MRISSWEILLTIFRLAAGFFEFQNNRQFQTQPRQFMISQQRDFVLFLVTMMPFSQKSVYSPFIAVET